MKSVPCKFYFLVILLIAQACKQKENPHLLSYRLSHYPISCVSTGISNPGEIFFDDGLKIGLLEGEIIKFIDAEQNSVIQKLHIPHSYHRLNGMSFINQRQFALFLDSVFLLHDEGNWVKKEISMYNDSTLVLGRHDIVYFPEQQFIVAGFFYRNKKPEIPYSGPFLGIYSTDEDIFKPLPFNYPVPYHQGKRGIPKFFLSRNDSFVFISFEWGKKVYAINIETEQSHEILFSGELTVNPPKLSGELDKKVKLDRYAQASLHSGAFGQFLPDKSGLTGFRAYYPPLPNQLKDGSFLSSKDRGMCLLRYGTEKAEYIRLPHGVYYMPDEWKKHEKSCYYNKITDKNKDGKWEITIHDISVYDFPDGSSGL